MVFQWVHSVFVIVIPVQLTVGCVGRIFHDVDTATGEVFWFVGISISILDSRTCQRRSTDEMQRLQPRILFMHVCWLPRHWTHQVRVIKSNWSRLQVQDHFSEPNMATIFDAMAPGGGYNWAPLTAISMDMFIHDYSLHPLVDWVGSKIETEFFFSKFELFFIDEQSHTLMDFIRHISPEAWPLWGSWQSWHWRQALSLSAEVLQRWSFSIAAVHTFNF